MNTKTDQKQLWKLQGQVADRTLKANTDIMSLVRPRVSRASVRRGVRGARKGLHAVLRQSRAFDGGLAAELESAELLTSQAVGKARLAARKSWLSRRGREIDLKTLLGQLKSDGTPVWTIVDPVRPLRDSQGRTNEGKYDTDGLLFIGQVWRRFWESPQECPLRCAFVPDGFVPLPPKVRKLASDPKIRRRALWVGVLYQPQSWTEVKPDPALVVEWKDLPGKYYALAVWGGDYHRIMEFVD